MSKPPETDTFIWRDRNHSIHHPEIMSTDQLFYTLRMVWNHHMPEEAKLHPYYRYTFDDFYTDAYLTDAINAFTAELTKRAHLSYGMRLRLSHMLNWLDTYRINTEV